MPIFLVAPYRVDFVPAYFLLKPEFTVAVDIGNLAIDHDTYLEWRLLAISRIVNDGFHNRGP